VNNLHFFFQELKDNSQRETANISGRVLLRNIFRRCKAFLEDRCQHFETVERKTVSWTARENKLQILDDAGFSHDDFSVMVAVLRDTVKITPCG
jgi:hypothetical protein